MKKIFSCSLFYKNCEGGIFIIKLVAVDVDGTFVRDDYTFDNERFKKIFARMTEKNCKFVVASGNQYYQLRDVFDEYGDKISYVAENGAFVKDCGELIFAADIPKATVNFVVDVCKNYPEILNVLCGVKSAYCECGKVSEEFFNLTKIYYHKLEWTDDFKKVDDQILKFAPTVPVEKTFYYYDLLKEKLAGKLTPTTSGHGSIDLILPNCHKAAGLKKLIERWKISPAECVAFGDGGNDIEMLKFCGESYAMENAPQNVIDAAKKICPSNNADGVLITLEKFF